MTVRCLISMHGLRNGAFAGKKRKFFWYFILIASASMCLFTIVKLFTSYFIDKPYTIITTTNYQEHMAFPSLSICNQNSLIKKKTMKNENMVQLLKFLQTKILRSATDAIYERIDKKIYNDITKCMSEKLTSEQISKLSLLLASIKNVDFMKELFVYEDRLKRLKRIEGKFPSDLIEFPFNISSNEITKAFHHLWPYHVDLEEIFRIFDSKVKYFLYCMTEHPNFHHKGQFNNFQTVFFYRNSLNYVKVIVSRLVTEMEVDQELNEIFWNANNNVFLCRFSGQSCEYLHNIFSKVYSENGPCYTIKWDRVFGGQQTIPGVSGGLTLGIDLKNYNSLPLLLHAAKELRLTIHSEDTPPSSMVNGISLATGEASFLSISEKNWNMLSVKDGGGCYPGEKLKRFSTFSPVACQMEAVYDHILQKCNCTSIFDRHLNMNNHLKCNSLNEFLCAMDNNNHPDGYNQYFCDHIACSFTEYQVDSIAVSLDFTGFIEDYVVQNEMACLTIHQMKKVPFDNSMWKPLPHVLREFHDRCLTRYNWKENLLLIYVYYDELKSTTTTQKKQKNVLDFISIIGGALGLYLGMSLVTLIEMFSVMVYSCRTRTTCKNDSTKTT
ncbi:hypothetical protein SNEBB_004178 [Seison nebaliae]|nr:hypothetical protein SNEBB_004178 [Seison nebaliae]